MRSRGIVIAAVFVACASRAGDREPVEAWLGEMRAVEAAGPAGFVSASILGGGSRVNATLSGAAPGARHRWHVHAGRCGSGGPVVGEEEAYPVLEANARGNASATATLSVELAAAGDYHVDVHATNGEPGAVIACGELVPTG